MLPMENISKIIEALGLIRHPEEGGFFRETYRSGESLPKTSLPGRYPSARSLGTAIYYLLDAHSCSALHRLRTDEIFHFYAGDPVVMLLLHPGGVSERVRLGSRFLEGEHPQFVVPRGVWFGACLDEGGAWALMGTTMAPGFEYEDYENADIDSLAQAYPAEEELIRRLSLRSESREQ